MDGNHRCVWCGLILLNRVHWETIPCDDYAENGREVTLPFCNEGCAKAYIDAMDPNEYEANERWKQFKRSDYEVVR